MILFLSKSFQLRLRLAWKPDLRAFLVGDRNLYFYVPEMIIETPEVNEESIDRILERGAAAGPWQLLGFITPDRQLPYPGYAQVTTSGKEDPRQWEAGVFLLSGAELESAPIEIRLSD